MSIAPQQLPENSLCRFQYASDAPRLGWYHQGQIADLSTGEPPELQSIAALLASGIPLHRVADRILPATPRHALDDVTVLAPLDSQEVWAAGVTYLRSRTAREQESEHAADMYTRVYEAERPELFYKAGAHRTAGPDGQIRVRDDSRWSVPEPELAVLFDSELRIAGYTIGNDVSARDIEGENPLYLPQAKVYDGACALGPCIVPAAAIANPYNVGITCSIAREGAVIWQDETNTSQLHRRLDELAAYLGRACSFPSGVFLLTGTCLVPPDTLSLRAGDVVEIAIDGLGLLRNTVG